MDGLPRGKWRETARLHTVAFEKFLLDSGSNIPGDKTVYIAGMIARGLDLEYARQIESWLVDPDQIEKTVQKHDPYIGQNAPIVTISRINAEFLTVQIAVKDAAMSRYLEMLVPVRYFGLAAFYSRMAGNLCLSEIFSYLRNHYAFVLELLGGYLRHIGENGTAVNPLPRELWKKFATEGNERNTKKESRERAGLDSKRKTNLPFAEFNAMINFQSPN